jgi:hypothetical protein
MNDVDDASARLDCSIAAESAVAAQLAELGESKRERSAAREGASERIAALRAEVSRGETQRAQLVAAARDTAARSALLAEENASLESALEVEKSERAAQLEVLTSESSDQAARMKETLLSRVSVLEQMRATARELELSVRFGAPAERAIIDSARSQVRCSLLLVAHSMFAHILLFQIVCSILLFHDQAGRSPAMRKATTALARDRALLERATLERKKVEAAMKEAVAELEADDVASGGGASGGGAAETDGAAADHGVMVHYLKQVLYRYLIFPDTEQGALQRASLKPMILELAGLDPNGALTPK